jgi:hypothetical protein
MRQSGAAVDGRCRPCHSNGHRREPRVSSASVWLLNILNESLHNPPHQMLLLLQSHGRPEAMRASSVCQGSSSKICCWSWPTQACMLNCRQYYFRRPPLFKQEREQRGRRLSRRGAGYAGSAGGVLRGS